jgi:hypothetical protein
MQYCFQTYDKKKVCFEESSRKITRESGYKQQKYIHFVRDAVYAIAHALHDMFTNKCGKTYRGMCKDTKHIDGETLIQYIANVSFKGLYLYFAYHIHNLPLNIQLALIIS